MKTRITVGLGILLRKMREINRRPGSYAHRIGWKETIYHLENGNWMYVGPGRKDCLIHWEVSKKGKIVNYMLEGDGCR